MIDHKVWHYIQSTNLQPDGLVIIPRVRSQTMFTRDRLWVGSPKISTFCQQLQSRTRQHRGVGGLRSQNLANV